MEARQLWEKTVDILRQDMTQVSYSTWISKLEPVCVSEDMFVLLTHDGVALQTLRNLYSDPIARAATAASGQQLSTLFILPEERDRYAQQFREGQRQEEGRLNPKYTFDSFVIGSSNNMAHAAAMAVAENPATAYNPLFIYGGVGLGKTHLMHAIGNHMQERHTDFKIMYVTSETFSNELIESIKNNTNAQFRNKYRNVDVLMVDDVQFISGRTSTQEEFFNTFNALYTNGKQIIISSDRPPRELLTLEERLKSRFEGGLITDIQQPDLETRVAILAKKASQENIAIDRQVLVYIAEKVNSHIRLLEGSLTRVLAYARLKGRQPDIELTDMALRDIVPGYDGRKITTQLIQQVVADYYGIDTEAMLSKRRTTELSLPRQIAMYFVREFTNESLKTVGASFGGRDYSTVISALHKIEDMCREDADFALTMEDIRSRIRGR